MSQLTYNDVSDIFRDGIVWCEGREEYWYQRAWAILEKEGLTQYNSDYELCIVKLYAITLTYVYKEFCEKAFDEYHEKDLLPLASDEFTYFEIGQIYSKVFPEEDILDEDEVNDALIFIVEKLQYPLFKAIGHHMNESEVFAWMYCTGFTPTKLEPVYEDDSELKPEDGSELPDEKHNEILDEVPYEIGSYPEYENMLQEEDVLDIVLNDVELEKLEAFEYICSLI